MTTAMPMLQIFTNYTPRSHVLCGPALKNVYVSFRMEVLRVEEWSTWHSKMNMLPGGKGWCIRKQNLDDLTRKLNEYKIPFEYLECQRPSKPATKQGKKKKGPKTAYAFFAKEKWSEAKARLPLESQKDMSKISKEVSKMWKESSFNADTKWHQQAINARAEFKGVLEPKILEETHVVVLPGMPESPRVLPPMAIPDSSDTPPEIYSPVAVPVLSHPPETYEDEWERYPHEMEVFPFTEEDENGTESIFLCRFIYEKDDKDHTLSFRTSATDTKESIYKKAWELAHTLQPS